MITFLTLFLGLVQGPHDVELDVTEPVARIELLLDGEVSEVLDEPPWRLELDFGRELRPRRLVAVARDENGRELGRAEQLLNVPRPPVETRLILDEWSQGSPRRARLAWESTEGLGVEAIAFSLNQKPVQASRAPDLLDEVKLPPTNIDIPSFVRAELLFVDGSSASAEAAFGGKFGEEIQTELTAIPVEGKPKGRGGRESPGDAGGLRWRGEPLAVSSVDGESGEVIVVRDELTRPKLLVLAGQLRRATSARIYNGLRLDPETRVRIASGELRTTTHGYELLSVSRPFAKSENHLPTLLVALSLEGQEGRAKSLPSQRITDAVAAAGLRAAGSQRRRAVLLVVNDCSKVSGVLSAGTVADFLEELGVPLQVWTLSGDPGGEEGFCSQARRLGRGQDLVQAVADLREEIDRQRILWVEGRPLLRELEIAPESPWRLAGQP
jgi:hypothetical protein